MSEDVTAPCLNAEGKKCPKCQCWEVEHSVVCPVTGGATTAEPGAPLRLFGLGMEHAWPPPPGGVAPDEVAPGMSGPLPDEGGYEQPPIRCGTFTENTLEREAPHAAICPCPVCRVARLLLGVQSAADDLGNVIYNIETGERRAAEEQATEIRTRLEAAIAANGGGR